MLIYIMTIIISVLVDFAAVFTYGYFSSSPHLLFDSITIFLFPVILIALDGVIAFIIHRFPEKYFNPGFKRFQVSRKEVKFYMKLKINSWKDRIPDMGQLCDFKKVKVDSFEEKYLSKFAVETCYAGVIHIGMALIGFLTVIFSAIFIPGITLPIALPLTLINFILNIPPIMIQRYNRPRLLKAIKFFLNHDKDTKLIKF